MKQSTRISKILLAEIRELCTTLDPQLTISGYIESRLKQALKRDKAIITGGEKFEAVINEKVSSE